MTDNTQQSQPHEVVHDRPQTSVAETDERAQQEELHRRYVEQQHRLACPACGEEPFLG